MSDEKQDSVRPWSDFESVIGIAVNETWYYETQCVPVDLDEAKKQAEAIRPGEAGGQGA